jgi:DNA repair protein RadC
MMLQCIRSTWAKQILKPQDIAGVIREILNSEDQIDQDKEHLWTIGLNAAHCIKYVDLVALGVVDRCLVHCREIFRRAVHKGISALIVVHNHPSNQPEPSTADKEIIYKIKVSGELLGIELLDAVIVATDSHYSFAEDVWN